MAESFETKIAARLAELQQKEGELNSQVLNLLGQVKEGERRLGLVQARIEELAALVEKKQESGDSSQETVVRSQNKGKIKSPSC